MRDEHDFRRALIGEEENLLEHFHDKVHGSHLIVVDRDAVKRLEVCVDRFDDFNFGDAMHVHLVVVLIPRIAKLGHFFFAQFNICGVEIFLDVLRIE